MYDADFEIRKVEEEKNMTIEAGMLRWAEQAGVQAQIERGSILFSVNGESGSWLAKVNAFEEDGMLFILTAYPFHVAEKGRVNAMAALAEITSQLKMGAFYMDPTDGHINYRLGQQLPDGEERQAWIERFIMIAMNVTDVYYRKIMALAAVE